MKVGDDEEEESSSDEDSDEDMQEEVQEERIEPQAVAKESIGINEEDLHGDEEAPAKNMKPKRPTT